MRAYSLLQLPCGLWCAISSSCVRMALIVKLSRFRVLNCGVRQIWGMPALFGWLRTLPATQVAVKFILNTCLPPPLSAPYCPCAIFWYPDIIFDEISETSETLVSSFRARQVRRWPSRHVRWCLNSCVSFCFSFMCLLKLALKANELGFWGFGGKLA